MFILPYLLRVFILSKIIGCIFGFLNGCQHVQMHYRIFHQPINPKENIIIYDLIAVKILFLDKHVGWYDMCLHVRQNWL
ncbi:hypothetical protein PAGL106935_16255 [Paenibacillus glucanolyticus]